MTWQSRHTPAYAMPCHDRQKQVQHRSSRRWAHLCLRLQPRPSSRRVQGMGSEHLGSSSHTAGILKPRLKSTLVPTKPATKAPKDYHCTTFPIFSFYSKSLWTCDRNQDAELDGSFVSVHIVLHSCQYV